MSVGKRIRELRMQQGITQEELAKKVGCDQSTISRIEFEERNPSFEVAISIAGVLGVSAEYLRKGESKNKE